MGRGWCPSKLGMLLPLDHVRIRYPTQDAAPWRFLVVIVVVVWLVVIVVVGSLIRIFVKEPPIRRVHVDDKASWAEHVAELGWGLTLLLALICLAVVTPAAVLSLA